MKIPTIHYLVNSCAMSTTTSFCYIATVKQPWVWLVLTWAIAWEHRMLLAHKTESCTKNWKWQR